MSNSLHQPAQNNPEKPDSLLILKQYPLFEKLSHGEYKELSVSDNYKEAKQGEFIYFEAFQHHLIYFIKTGYIRLGYLDDAGQRITKDILGPGDFFGQITLERTSLHGEFAQAFKDSVSLCSFTIDHFSKLLNSRPDIAVKYSKMIGLRMKRFENRLINILHKDVRARLIAFLKQLLQDAVKPRVISDYQVTITNYLTHEEIAHLIGTSRQTVTTLLNNLQEAGICIYSRKEITFFNAEKTLNNI
jgi:CRP/FNR family transcriptional regulator, cyclic AMP receptor protein